MLRHAGSSIRHAAKRPVSAAACAALLLLPLAGCVETVTYRSPDLGMVNGKSERVRGAFALPPGKGPFPAVVLLHTCGGVLPHVSQDWPDFLTGEGYAVLTVDTFGSRNAGRCPEARHLGGITMWRDAIGALDYLAARPDIDGDRIAVMGFSLGAMALEGYAGQTMKPAGRRTFRAGISVYGNCFFAGDPPFPILAIIGTEDRNHVNCPKHYAHVAVEIIPGATHAFDQPQITTPTVVSGGFTAIYSWPAVRQARTATRDFLAKNIGR